jgi:hypothetical protein
LDTAYAQSAEWQANEPWITDNLRISSVVGQHGRVTLQRMPARPTGSPGAPRILATSTPPTHRSSWHTDELRVSLMLDQDFPEALELRRIVADSDQVSELDLTMTLADTPGHRSSGPTEIGLDVIYGGRVIYKTLEPATTLASC